MMKLRLERFCLKNDYTIGHLYINDKLVCDTLEDIDRSLRDDMSFAQINAIKVKHTTAIPTGTYAIDLKTVSPKYSNYSRYKFAKAYNARMPRLVNVRGYEGVLIHPGNTAKDTDGCILVGQNKVVGQVVNSQNTWKQLMDTYFVPARSMNDKVIIEVTYAKNLRDERNFTVK